MLQYPSVFKYYSQHRFDLLSWGGSNVEDRAAVIIEPRDISTLSWTVSNIAYFSHWPIKVFHSKKNKHCFDGLPISHRFEIPEDFDVEDYNRLLSSLDFWNTMPAHVLIFQHDSFMLRSGIDSFIQYDYVGAPWSRENLFALPVIYNIGNGGFSLRRRDKMVEIIQAIPDRKGLAEDIYFAQGFLKVNGLLPSLSDQVKFSVEQVFYSKPLAVHAPWLAFNEKKLNKIFQV